LHGLFCCWRQSEYTVPAGRQGKHSGIWLPELLAKSSPICWPALARSQQHHLDMTFVLVVPARHVVQAFYNNLIFFLKIYFSLAPQFDKSGVKA